MNDDIIYFVLSILWLIYFLLSDKYKQIVS